MLYGTLYIFFVSSTLTDDILLLRPMLSIGLIIILVSSNNEVDDKSILQIYLVNNFLVGFLSTSS